MLLAGACAACSSRSAACFSSTALCFSALRSRASSSRRSSSFCRSAISFCCRICSAWRLFSSLSVELRVFRPSCFGMLSSFSGARTSSCLSAGYSRFGPSRDGVGDAVAVLPAVEAAALLVKRPLADFIIDCSFVFDELNVTLRGDSFGVVDLLSARVETDGLF